MSSLFNRKVRRNYRTKADQSDDEAIYEPESLYEQGSKEVICGPSVSGPSGSMKKIRSVLSFGDDLVPDDGDEFRVKKSNLSRRLSKQTKEQKKKKHSDTELPKVINKRELVEAKVEPPEDPEESRRKLENLRRQLLDLNEADPLVVVHPSSESSGVSSLFKKGEIPDAATIHLARKQREKAKILMDSADSSSELQNAGLPASDGKRFIREEDDDDDDDLDTTDDFRHMQTNSGRRPAFVVSDARDTVTMRPVIGARLKRREAELDSLRKDFLAAEHGSDRDSDQETAWERQQIQKAMITQNPAVLDAIQPTSRTDDDPNILTMLDPSLAGLDASSVTVANLKSRLQEKFDSVSKSLSKHETDLADAKADLARGRKVIAECRENLPTMAKAFSFAQEISEYVNDLVDCFNEKMSKIEYLERRTVMLYRERFEKLAERRRLDMKDMAELATQPAGQPAPTNPEEKKLFEIRRKRCSERDARRVRRQRARESSNATASLQPPSSIGHLDGTSTDDEESQAVVAKRKADIDALLVDAGALFDDVVDDFCQLPLILHRFADWHCNFPETYTDAYVALCLPQLLSPIVRVQLIGWNPLSSSCTSIESMEWFRDLLDFVCLPADIPSPVNGNIKMLNDDLRILPLTVEKVMLERLNELVAASWDPLSRTESSRLVALVKDLANNYPTVRVGSRSTEKLFTTIVKRMELTIQEDIFIPLYSKHLLQNRQGAPFLFFDRQFRVAMKLLRNILLWHEYISTEALQHVSLTCLINRYLLVGLASLMSVATGPVDEKSTNANTTPRHIATLAFQDCVDRLTELVDAIPSDWLDLKVPKVKLENGESETKSALSGPFAQLRRFVSQLLDHCSDRHLSRDVTDDGIRPVSASLEREWFTSLRRLKDVLG